MQGYRFVVSTGYDDGKIRFRYTDAPLVEHQDYDCAKVGVSIYDHFHPWAVQELLAGERPACTLSPEDISFQQVLGAINAHEQFASHEIDATTKWPARQLAWHSLGPGTTDTASELVDHLLRENDCSVFTPNQGEPMTPEEAVAGLEELLRPNHPDVGRPVRP